MAHFQMISHNGTLFNGGDIVLSTVQLPIKHGDFLYESCIFVQGESEVLGRYETFSEAILDHVKLRQKYKLK